MRISGVDKHPWRNRCSKEEKETKTNIAKAMVLFHATDQPRWNRSELFAMPTTFGPGTTSNRKTMSTHGPSDHFQEACVAFHLCGSTRNLRLEGFPDDVAGVRHDLGVFLCSDKPIPLAISCVAEWQARCALASIYLEGALPWGWKGPPKKRAP
jgi:hypothetical protein